MKAKDDDTEDDTIWLTPHEAHMIEELKNHMPFDEEEGYFEMSMVGGERILIAPCGSERPGYALVKMADAGPGDPEEVTFEKALCMSDDRWVLMHQQDFVGFAEAVIDGPLQPIEVQ